MGYIKTNIMTNHNHVHFWWHVCMKQKKEPKTKAFKDTIQKVTNVSLRQNCFSVDYLSQEQNKNFCRPMMD